MSHPPPPVVPLPAIRAELCRLARELPRPVLQCQTRTEVAELLAAHFDIVLQTLAGKAPE